VNFYKHYIGDFQRDTGHLSLTERGAYRALLDAFYASEKSLSGNATELCRVVGAFTKTERAAVTRVLKEFWHQEDGGWVNARAKREISKADHQRDVNRAIAVSREANRKAIRSSNEPSHEPSTNRSTNDQPIQTPDSRHKNLEGAPRPAPPVDNSRDRRRSRRCPPDWQPPPDADVREVAKFRDHEFAQPKSDWDAAWRNWKRKAAEIAPSAHAPPSDAGRAWNELIATGGAKRDARVQRALEAVGGWLAVKSRTPFTEPKLRAEFCAAYTEAA